MGSVERLDVDATDLNDLEGRIDFLASQRFVERGFHDPDFGRDAVAFFGTGHEFTEVFDDAVGKAQFGAKDHQRFFESADTAATLREFRVEDQTITKLGFAIPGFSWGDSVEGADRLQLVVKRG